MRIGLNATCFNDRPSGANQRFVGIYGALIRARRDWEFIVYQPTDCAVANWFGDAPNVRAMTTPLVSTDRLQRTLRGLAFWPGQLRRDRVDLFETFHLPLVAAACPAVVTIHDARSTTRGVGSISRAVGLAVTRHALRTADLVITVSDVMKRDLLAIEPSARISTIYNGIDPSMFAVSSQASPSLALPTSYILAVGHLEARKNLVRLVDAMPILRKSSPDLSLVIVGNEGGAEQAIRAAIARHGLGDAVRLLHGVGDADLAAIYRQSRAVVFPSTYEGFGIPILEAMAARRPLILSDIPVFAELTEGQGAYFDQLDPSDIARTIAAVLGSPARQEQLVSYGDRRVQDFRFDHLAGQVESAYRQALATWQ